MRNKVVTMADVLAVLRDGQTIMFGGLQGKMAAEEIIDGMLEKGVSDIEAIAITSGLPDTGCGRLLAAHRFRKIHTTHIGLNPEAKKQMLADELEIDFIPYGNFVERIRCGGFGLGGCLTKTGLDTSVSEGKQIITVDGESYMLEAALRADVAIVKAHKADTLGNLQFRGMNGSAGSGYMCYAADLVIAEVDELAEIGELGPDDIDVPAPLVDMVYVREKKHGLYPGWARLKAQADTASKEIKAEAAEDMSENGSRELSGRELIAARCARFFKDGDMVNLGIGIPAMCTNYLPEGVDVWMTSDTGLCGLTKTPDWYDADLDMLDAGDMPAALMPGGSIFEPDAAMGMIRSGRIDACVLGTLQVDQQGNLANWIVPGKVIPGMGGAMDFCSGKIRHLIVATEHCDKSGRSKIMKRCTLPLTGAGCVTEIVTERCCFEVTAQGLVLKEIAKGYTVEDIAACTEADYIVAEDLCEMHG